jgi:HD superfamily phosphohydrolase
MSVEANTAPFSLPKFWWDMFCKRDVGQRILQTEEHVHDAVYGKLSVRGPLAGFMNLPIVWRLTTVYQLGLTYYSRPTATHTRYSHSLDVALIAKSIMETVARVGTLKLKCGEKEHEYVIRNGALLADAAGVIGLLHDIGHSPFSHAVDGYAAYILDIYYRLWKILKQSQQPPQQQSQQPPHVHPDFLMRATQERGGGKYDDVISGILLKECDALRTALEATRNEYLLPLTIQGLFLKEWQGLWNKKQDIGLLILGQIIFGHKDLTMDVDRMAYLVKDAYFAGAPEETPEKDTVALLREINKNIIEGQVTFDKNTNAFVVSATPIFTIECPRDEHDRRPLPMVMNSQENYLTQVVEKLRSKMYREVYENIQKSVVDAIVSYLYYTYLNLIGDELKEEIDELKEEIKRDRPRYQHLEDLKESLLGTMVMSSDLLISHICSVMSYKSHSNPEAGRALQLCELIPALRTVFATVSRSDTMLIDNRSALYVIRAHKEFIRLFVDELKRHSGKESLDRLVVAAVAAGSRILSGSLNLLISNIPKLEIIPHCRHIIMPIHYMFNRLGNKLDSAFYECIKSQKDQAGSSGELCLSNALETVLSDQPIVAVVYMRCDSDKDLSGASFRQLEEVLAGALARTYLIPLGAEASKKESPAAGGAVNR